jgi:hydroxymethylpyrimidine pyrophosphatase-like HAD family hydrolase
MKIPLTVDLDGTLIRSDTMSQSFLALIKKKPLLAFIDLAKLCQGN